MVNTTVFHEKHQQAHAKLVDFFGWEMPIHYGSQLEEHHIVRNDAGMFDVSHMTRLDVAGPQATAFLQYLLANDVAKLKSPGKALYTCMLKPNGGIIDDLIVYHFSDTSYRLVLNAATREKDLAWIKQHATGFNVTLTTRDDLAMIAIQGPNAFLKTKKAVNPNQADAIDQLKPFFSINVGEWQLAFTGYTGENGLEILLPQSEAPGLWDALLKAGVHPCGLGARDTLRLEAGMNLYGADMDETTSPLISNLAWTVALQPDDRDFIGRAALLEEKHHGIKQQLVGLVLSGKGVLRSHQKIICEDGQEGFTTSGSFSPTLKKSIALARVPMNIGPTCQVLIRDKLLPVDVVTPSFVRHNKAIYKPLT